MKSDIQLAFEDFPQNLDFLIPVWVFRIYNKARYPVRTYRDWRHWMSRPSVGDYVEDCSGHVLKVIKIGSDKDQLFLEDGTSASWTSCCDKPPKGNVR